MTYSSINPNTGLYMAAFIVTLFRSKISFLVVLVLLIFALERSTAALVSINVANGNSWINTIESISSGDILTFEAGLFFVIFFVLLLLILICAGVYNLSRSISLHLDATSAKPTVIQGRGEVILRQLVSQLNLFQSRF